MRPMRYFVGPLLIVTASLHQQATKVLWETCGLADLTWSNHRSNKPVKQKWKVLVVAAVALDLCTLWRYMADLAVCRNHFG